MKNSLIPAKIYEKERSSYIFYYNTIPMKIRRLISKESKISLLEMMKIYHGESAKTEHRYKNIIKLNELFIKHAESNNI